MRTNARNHIATIGNMVLTKQNQKYMIDFKNAFRAMALLNDRTSKQVIEEAFPQADTDTLIRLTDKYKKHHTTWGFFSDITPEEQKMFDDYLHKLVGISPISKQYPITESDAFPSFKKRWYIKNAAETLYLAMTHERHEGTSKWTRDRAKAKVFNSIDDAQERIKDLPELDGPYTITTK